MLESFLSSLERMFLALDSSSVLRLPSFMSWGFSSSLSPTLQDHWIKEKTCFYSAIAKVVLMVIFTSISLLLLKKNTKLALASFQAPSVPQINSGKSIFLSCQKKKT